MTAPYYSGDNVPLGFTITDSEGAVVPSACKVYIYAVPSPGNLVPVIENVDAVIESNAVSYTVPTSATAHIGKYITYFLLTLTSGERTHRIEFAVIGNPRS